MLIGSEKSEKRVMNYRAIPKRKGCQSEDGWATQGNGF